MPNEPVFGQNLAHLKKRIHHLTHIFLYYGPILTLKSGQSVSKVPKNFRNSRDVPTFGQEN